MSNLLLIWPAVFALGGQAAPSTETTIPVLSARLAVLENDHRLLEAEVARLRVELARLTAEAAPSERNESSAPPSKSQPLTLYGAPARGSEAAPLVMIEYSDFECEFCGRFHKETFPLILRDYVREGKVRYVFKNLPLEGIHPRAMRMAAIAVCADEQGRFWDVHEHLFAEPPLGDALTIDWAKSVGLDRERMLACLERGAEVVRAQALEASRLGISGTPGFVIGRPTEDGRVEPLRILSGAQPYEVFKTVLSVASDVR